MNTKHAFLSSARMGLLLLSLVFLGIQIPAKAIMPPTVTDKDLAASPVIVVAKWDKTPIQTDSWPDERRGGTLSEAFADLNVLRVIRGDIKPGTLKVRWGAGIDWETNGGMIRTDPWGTENEKVTEPLIWFLKKEPSWNPKNNAEYFTIGAIRPVQPIILEPYFKAITTDHPGPELSTLLASPEPTLVGAVLHYICEKYLPWPYAVEARFDPGPVPWSTAFGDQTQAVKEVIDRPANAQNRTLAVSIYAQFKGPECMPYLRSLLADREMTVRMTAATLLMAYRDVESIEPINQIIDGSECADYTCTFIKQAAAFKDLRLVPALIKCLENENRGMRTGDDINLPALKSRQALHDLTGFWFPYDVSASLKAWQDVADLSAKDARLTLAKLLPKSESPWKAELAGSGPASAICKITNISSEDATLAKLPDSILQKWLGSSSNRSAKSGESNTQSDFLTLKPGESTEFKLPLDDDFLQADQPAARKLELLYTSTGTQWHLKAWVGILEVKFGPQWKEK